MLGDAFNDIAVPYHLTTKEFNEMVADHLTERGIYLINVVDGRDYDFLRSFMKTLTKTFRERRPDDGARPGGAGRAGDVRRGREPRARCRGSRRSSALDRLQPFFQEKDTVELTDDHVPVDQLLAPVYGDSLEEHEDAAAGE